MKRSSTSNTKKSTIADRYKHLYVLWANLVSDTVDCNKKPNYMHHTVWIVSLGNVVVPYYNLHTAISAAFPSDSTCWPWHSGRHSESNSSNDWKELVLCVLETIQTDLDRTFSIPSPSFSDSIASSIDIPCPPSWTHLFWISVLISNVQNRNADIMKRRWTKCVAKWDVSYQWSVHTVHPLSDLVLARSTAAHSDTWSKEEWKWPQKASWRLSYLE